MSLSLRPFEPQDEHAAIAAHAALAAEGFTFLLGYNPETSWADWLDRVERTLVGVDLSPNMVRSALLAAEVDGRLVGRVSVRFELNEWLAREGGHIGYAVVPAFRRKGHATEMLRRAIGLAHEEGVQPLLVICDETNVASASVIERCGGVFEGPATTPEGIVIRRYWV